MKNIITCAELQQLLPADIAVIDVMTPEDFTACHISGAINACIYEMVFLERVAECGIDHDTAIVVYDASGGTRTAETARQRLLQSGYANVAILQGGLAAWRSAGLPVETGEQPAEPEVRDGTFRIDTENSSLEWIGRNITNRHIGRIAIQSGEVVIQGGRPDGGTIILDMDRLSDTDLQDPDWNHLLIRHLKSDDFFAVAKFPTASFRLNSWEEGEPISPGALCGIATGELTIRDVTRKISFPAMIAPQADGGIKAHAALDINRTLWNVCYGSGKLFERLGMHLVHDIISLELFIQAR